MDELTKGIGDYLEKRLSHPQKEQSDLIKESLIKLQAFTKKLHKKYHSDYSMGFTYSIPMTDEDEIVHVLIEVLLYDKDHYGF